MESDLMTLANTERLALRRVLGARFAGARLSLSITPEQLQMTPHLCARIERGDVFPPHDALYWLAEQSGLNLAWFYGRGKP